MVWRKGQRLSDGNRNDYFIEKVLGEGGFGITYLAKDYQEKPVAIKTLNDVVRRRDDFAILQEDFMNEAIKLARFNHPHIVQVKKVFCKEPFWCMVMEYIEGKNLDSLGILSESQALAYIKQIGQALTLIHSNGLLHRDVKPENIMVRSGKSEAVLIDFGFAREFISGLTQSHTALGTDGYAPPEQYSTRAKRGAYTDVYGLAASLYKLLTGRKPVNAPSRLFGEQLVPPNQLTPNISEIVNEAIVKGLDLQADSRPQSIHEFLELLQPKCDIDNLTSDKGLDCQKLRELLKVGNWKEANEETARALLEMAGKEKESWLNAHDPTNFICTHIINLRTVDRLWVKYSKGRFGFSVQKLIWEGVGGKPGEYDTEIYKKFGEKVGWYVKEKDNWKYWDDLTFCLNAPVGHLPMFGEVYNMFALILMLWWMDEEASRISSILSRRDL